MFLDESVRKKIIFLYKKKIKKFEYDSRHIKKILLNDGNFLKTNLVVWTGDINNLRNLLNIQTSKNKRNFFY